MTRLETHFLQLREEVKAEFSAVRSEMRMLGETLRTELRAEIRAGDKETRRLMRVRHEEVIARLAVLGGTPGEARRSASRQGRTGPASKRRR